MPTLDHLQHLDLEVKVGEVDDTGTFEGLASVFGQLDGMGDTVAHGAFKKSLAAHRRAGRMPLMLWAHDLATPIGRWLDIQEMPEGLRVRGKLLLDTAKGREVYSMLKERVVDGLSIGFRTVLAARSKAGRVLKEIDLAEISVVSLPALSTARVSSVKSATQPRRETVRPSKDMMMNDDDAVREDAPEENDALDEIRQKVDEIETKASSVVGDLVDRIDRIETRLSRPGVRIESREDKAELERKAFVSFCRRGVEGMPDIERKVLTGAAIGSPATDGWQLVPQVFLTELIRNLVEISPMRQVARVQNVSSSPVLVPKRTAALTASWVAETAEHTTSEPAYAQQQVGIFEARVTVEVSNQLLEDSAFDLSAELARDFAEEFGRLEGDAFLRGNGTTEPEGMLTSDDFDTSVDALDADGIIDLYHAVPSVYASRGTWLLSRPVMGMVRKLRSASDGPYIWVDSIAPGNPPSLLGRPVVEMPGLTAGSPAIETAIFGDIAQAFRIFDRVGLEVLRDPYTKARNSIVCFHARRRVGSALVNAEAVKGFTTA